MNLIQTNFDMEKEEHTNGLQIFKNEQFGEVRALEDENGEPLFVAADVCRALGLEQVSRAMDRLDDDERGLLKVTHPQSPSKLIDVNAVTEPGLYHLVLCSNKPEAKAFKRWITHDVIPSIRKHGLYATQDTVEKMLSDPDTTIKLLQEIKSEREKRAALEGKVKQDAPKVLFADSVSAAHTSILVGELAKILKQNGVEIGQNRLFEYLRKNGYLISRQGTDFNMPTQYSMERGWFEIKESAITQPDGSVRATKTTKVTGKGQLYFVNLFLGKSEVAQ